MKTHLDPKEVLHLKELGVEFEDTADVWVKIGSEWERQTRESFAELEKMKPDIEKGLGFNLSDSECLPCPTLTNVLYKLPEELGDYMLKMYKYHDNYTFFYSNKATRPNCNSLPRFTHKYAIKAAYRALEWVSEAMYSEKEVEDVGCNWQYPRN